MKKFLVCWPHRTSITLSRHTLHQKRKKNKNAVLVLLLKCMSDYDNVSIDNSMISSDIWHKYRKRIFFFISKLLYVISWAVNLRQFWNITSGVYSKYHVQIMLLFVYTTTRKRFVIFTCRYIFQIKVKYHYSKPIKLQKFLM